MASISRDANGRRRIQFVGPDGQRRAIRLGKIPQKAAEAIKAKVEAVLAATLARISIDKETAEWIGGLDVKLYAKLAAVGLVAKRLEPEHLSLGPFLDSYIAMRADVKSSTATVYGHTRRCLIEYFGAQKPLSDITPGDADQWRIWLGDNQKLAANTVNRRCGIAKQFFRVAVRKRLITESPFADMKNCGVRGNKTRDYFISQADAQKVIDACPDAQWRLLFALSRYGGLRCPSEHLSLRWSDVDWQRERITIRSSKTEHHADGGIRSLPIFPELRPYLETVWEEAKPGSEFVISRYRDGKTNLRTQLERIIGKAGLTPWPKLFQNLRSTRETKLAESFLIHVVCAWIGNTQAVAAKHYLQVTDAHFQQAATGSEKAAQKAAQLGPEMGRKEKQPIPQPLTTLGNCEGLPYWTGVQVGDEGLEPWDTLPSIS